MKSSLFISLIALILPIQLSAVEPISVSVREKLRSIKLKAPDTLVLDLETGNDLTVTCQDSESIANLQARIAQQNSEIRMLQERVNWYTFGDKGYDN